MHDMQSPLHYLGLPRTMNDAFETEEAYLE